MDDFVTITTRQLSVEAHMVKGRLEAEGIDCFLWGDKLADAVGYPNSVASTWSNPLGGVQIRVRPADAEQAREVLREIEGDEPRTIHQSRSWWPFQWALAGYLAYTCGWGMGDLVHPIAGYVVGAAIFSGLVWTTFQKRVR
ncbi:MAG TPA: DUF2007 domain-containing protein [Abditibacteriaceae bacterium]